MRPIDAPLPVGNQCVLFGAGCPDLGMLLGWVSFGVGAFVLVVIFAFVRRMRRDSCVSWRRWSWPSLKRGRAAERNQNSE